MAIRFRRPDNEDKTIYGDIGNRLFAFAIDLVILYVPLVAITSFILSNFFEVSNQFEYTKFKALSTNPELARNPEALFSFMARNYPADMVIMIRQWVFSLAVNFGVIGLYTIPLNIRYGGTIGKMLLGLKIVDIITGEKMSVSQAIIRYLCMPLSIPFGLMYAGFRRDRRAWHDFLGDSVVIYSPDRWYKKHTDQLIQKTKKFFNLK